MAKADETAGLTAAELRKILRTAGADPVSAAFALDGTGRAVLQLDRRKPPRTLEKAIKDAAPDSRNHRFGTATTDATDPKLVRFVVNKAGGGLARKLVLALKGSGFSKVQIALDDGTTVEQHEEEDRDALPPAAGAAASPAPVPEPVVTPPAQAASHPAAPTIAKARLAWVATRQKLERDIDALHTTFSTSLKGHGRADDLGQQFRTRVDTVLDALDEALAHTLADINAAPDPTTRARHVDAAHQLIQRYQAHVAADQTVALLDRNPFAPMTIGKTVNATLAALSKAIR